MKFLKVSYEKYKAVRGIECKEEYDQIKLPKRATKGSSGYDIFNPYTFTLSPNESIKIPTGIRIDLSNDKGMNMFLECCPRSGLGFKYFVKLANTVGIIDEDYIESDNEGHIILKIRNEGNTGLIINQGEAFAQGIIQQYFKVDDDNVTETRNGGFGSTTGK